MSALPSRTLLVVGGGLAEIPLIQAGKALGYRVVTTGNRPDDRGHPFADQYASADFSDADDVHRVAVTVGAEAIVSGCNDFAALSTAEVASRLGLPGHDPIDTSLVLHHKDRFRQLLVDLGIPTPQALRVSSSVDVEAAIAELELPLIVKPVDLTGGKGMTTCHRADDVLPAVERALALTRQPYVVLEQFLTGTHHGFTCFIHQARVGFWFADDEQYFRNPFLVSGTSAPSSLPAAAAQELIDATERIASHLGLVDGLMHLQCVMTSAGPRVIELCRRCPGDLYPRFVQLATGFDYARSVVQAELGQLPAGGSAPTRSCVVRRCLMASQNGTLRAVHWPADVEARIVDRTLWWSSGQSVTNYLVDKFGIVFLQYEEEVGMRLALAELDQSFVVDVVP
jgi:biotin carboxylase